MDKLNTVEPRALNIKAGNCVSALNNTTKVQSQIEPQGSLETKIITLETAESLEVGLASLTHKLTGKEYSSLKHNISEIGITSPIEIYDGRLSDGRHRIRIARELGITELTAVTITEAPLANFMKHEVGRENSPVQKAILAAKLMSEFGIDRKEAEARTGANKNYINTIRRMMTLSESVVNEIYDGKPYLGMDKTRINQLNKIEADMKARASYNPFNGATGDTSIEDWDFDDTRPNRYDIVEQFISDFKRSGLSASDAIAILKLSDREQEELRIRAKGEDNLEDKHERIESDISESFTVPCSKTQPEAYAAFIEKRKVQREERIASMSKDEQERLYAAIARREERGDASLSDVQLTYFKKLDRIARSIDIVAKLKSSAVARKAA